MKKVLGLFLAVGLIGAFLSGCGKNEDKSTNGKVEIELFSQKVEVKDFLEEAITEFEKDNPDIKVKLTSIDNAETVLRTRMANNEAPELIGARLAYSDYREWAADSRFVDLTDATLIQNIQDGVAERFAVNDKIYGIPLTTNISGYFYNKDEFKRLGLDVPKNWSEMEELVEKIKKQDKIPFAAALASTEAGKLDGLAMMMWSVAAGGYEETQDLLLRSPKDSISLDNPAVKQAFEMLQILKKENIQKNANGASFTDAIAKFSAGETLMFENGSWALAGIEEQEPAFEVGMFPQPGLAVGDDITMGAPDLAYVVSADASEDKQAAAIKFLEWFSSPESMQKYYEYEGSPVFVKGVETDNTHEELAEVRELIGTDQYQVWLKAEWPAGEGFMNPTLDFVNTGDEEAYIEALNDYFNQAK